MFLMKTCCWEFSTHLLDLYPQRFHNVSGGQQMFNGLRAKDKLPGVIHHKK